MKQSRERSPRSHRTVLHDPRATTAELFQANAALAIPLVWALAKAPMNDRIGALQVCADTEPIPALTIEQLHPTRNVLSHSDLRDIRQSGTDLPIRTPA